MSPTGENPDVTVVVVPVGALGTGIQAEHLEAGMKMGAHVIALDAGSTDSGPSALATGECKYSRDAIRDDLRLLIDAQSRWKVPLLIGSCGTSGCDVAVDWTRDIAIEVCRELGVSPKIAVLYSEQDKAVLTSKIQDGKVRPLAPMGPLDISTVEACEHIVALMGPEPYIAALEAGADIILGGRTSDTAVLAALPLMRGANPGAAWHAGKTAECGGLCTVDPVDGGVALRVGADGFDVTPLSADNRCTPYSVSAHMLYENSNPFVLTEPGGHLDVTDADYAPLDDRTVRVTGSRFDVDPYTMKLEGAALGPFQTIMLIGITDPKVLRDIDGFLARLHATLVKRVDKVIGEEAGTYHISLRPYGWNAMSGLPVLDSHPTREIGLMFVATAETQEMALRIAKTCNPYFFHFPVQMGKELPTYGFTFSPAEIDRGRSYEFLLNHAVEVADGMELVRTAYIDLAQTEGAARHG